MLTTQEVHECWKAAFPNSSSYHRENISSTTFICWLAKDKSEVANGYMDNDPLSYLFSIDNITGDMKEYDVSLFVKPPKGSYLAFGRDKLRRKTIKACTKSKLVVRMQDIRTFVMANKDNAHQWHFDINTK